MAIIMKAYPQAKEANLQKDKAKALEEMGINILKASNLTFIENNGQLDSRVKYYVKGSGYSFYFTANEIKFSFIQKKATLNEEASLHLNALKKRRASEKDEFMRATIALELLDSNNEVDIVPQNKLNETVNYFKGNDSSKWKKQVPTYEKITYKEVWKGIDLVFYGKGDKLKYDFIVKPQALVEDIKFIYKGADETLIDEAGNLVLKTPLGELIYEKPICYQDINRHKVLLKGDFILKEEENVTYYGYKIQEEYDKKQPLIIDPGIVYSSYLGGSSNDQGTGITIDKNNNLYVVGITISDDFPVDNGFQKIFSGGLDIFVTKIDSKPSVVYSSYLGGSGWDVGNAIAVDQGGNIYITGSTDSTDFPLLNEFQSSNFGFGDAFITKIDSTPSIVYSSYLGGNDDDIGAGIAVDKDGNAYITGYTKSTDFPKDNAFQSIIGGDYDAFVTKIDSKPSIVYSSYLGGSGLDGGNGGIAVDESGNVYIAGQTESIDFPRKNAFSPNYGGGGDAFITKIDSKPSIVYSSYLGGSKREIGNGIAIDQYGNVYVTGITDSTDFPTIKGFQSSLSGDGDAFIAKIDSKPSIVYSSYLGGSNLDESTGIVVDKNGNAYVTGYTGSTNFPLVNAFQLMSLRMGIYDAFITKIDSKPSILYSSYLGGSGWDQGNGITVDENGNAYVTGYTESTDFPILNPFQLNYGENGDAFVTKIGTTLFLTVNVANLTAVILN